MKIAKKTFSAILLCAGIFIVPTNCLSATLEVNKKNNDVVLQNGERSKGSNSCVSKETFPAASEIKRSAEGSFEHFEVLYRKLHANPELSGMEKETSDAVAEELSGIKKKALKAGIGFDITRGVGGGYGIVAVIRNGKYIRGKAMESADSKVIMLRADMDALPIKEETGLPYASTKVVDVNGVRTPVMHACGHDVHTTVMLGILNTLIECANQWSGTIVAVFQPAEEKGGGSKQMIADGLFSRFPKPSYAICYHTFPDLPAGKVGYIYGPSMAGVRNYTITFYGEGTHGGYPHRGKDPIPAACAALLEYQTIVARTIPATKSSVFTVGAFNAGSRPNIVPDSVVMLATSRFFDNATDSTVLKRVTDITNGAAVALGMGSSRMPKIVTSEPAPPVVNNPELVKSVKEGMGKVIGNENLVEIDKVMGSEDFARYLQIIPGALFRLGVSPAGNPTSPLHTSHMAPDFKPAYLTGVEAMAGGVILILSIN